MASEGIETDSDESFWNDLDSNPLELQQSPTSYNSTFEKNRRVSGKSVFKIPDELPEDRYAPNSMKAINIIR